MSPIEDGDRPILVTGATGFVGRYVIEALKAAGVDASRIVGMCQSPEMAHQVENPIVLDLVDQAGIKRTISELRPCAIIHLAAIAMPRHAAGNRDLAWKTNFEATRVLAETCLRNNTNTRFVFAGSSEAYGSSFKGSTGPICEDAPLLPMNVYGATKAAADVMLGQMQRDGLDVVRFRAFNHTGARQSRGYVVPDFAHQIVNIERGLQPPEMLVGNLEACRDFLDVRDVSAAYVAALKISECSNITTAINVSSGTARSIKDVLEILLSISEKEISVVTDENRMRPSEVPIASGNNERLKTCFGWKEKFSIEETLLSVMRELRSK